MKFSRVAVTLVTAVATASMALTACSTSEEGSDDKSSTAFSYRMPDRFQNWLKDDKWFPEVEKKTGVTVNLVDGGPEEQYYQQLDLSLASGKIDDVVVASASQTDVYGPQGAFTDLAPLIAKDAPNIQKYLDANPDFKKLISSADGKIYGIPTESPRISEVVMYRSDMFAAAGITNPPRTMAEFADTLRTLKKHYAKTKDYYPLTGRDSFLRFLWAFDANFTVKDGQVKGVNGSATASVASADVKSAGYKELISYFHGLYDEGLIDPEWVAGANTEESWQTKMLTGKGSVSTDFFTRPSWFMNNGGPENDPKYDIAVLPAFLGTDGQQAKVPANPRWILQRTVAVSSQSPNTAAVLKLLDYLYTPEGQTLMHYGVEGQSYKMAAGKPTYTVDFAKESNQPAGTPSWNFLQDRLTFPVPVDNAAYYAWSDAKTKSFADKYFTTYLTDTPIIKYTPEQQEDRADVLASLEPYMLAEITKFVTGKRDLSTWSTFLSEIDTKGYTKLHDLDQSAWDAANK